MSHKIFLSHNYADKPIVEPVAIRLAEIFGQSKVFYDSWSISPGDGIIDQMNKGLEAPEFVFFFVTEKSLASPMVKLEWQNALFAASRGKTRIIPVRVDGSAMPPLLTQTLYIDMYSVGLEAAINQIVNVTQGNASFTPQHEGFSNLSWSAKVSEPDVLSITIRASHFLEPKASFVIETLNREDEFAIESNAPSFYGGHHKGGPSDPEGNKVNSFIYESMGAGITPSHPLELRVVNKGSDRIVIVAISHEEAAGKWRRVPMTQV